jgi:hypothetical protein
MPIRFAIFAFCLLTFPTVAVANCYYQGKEYAEGSRIGVLVCENGRWVPRP